MLPRAKAAAEAQGSYIEAVSYLLQRERIEVAAAPS